jgi:hypothetical protein
MPPNKFTIPFTSTACHLQLYSKEVGPFIDITVHSDYRIRAYQSRMGGEVASCMKFMAQVGFNISWPTFPRGTRNTHAALMHGGWAVRYALSYFLIPCFSRYGYHLILLQKDARRRGLHAIFDVVSHWICLH